MLRSSTIATLLLPAALMFGAPAQAQDKTAAIDKIFSFATAETPGCAVGVSQNGKVLVSKAYGLADVDARKPLSPTALFDIGSTQKQFTAASILLLVQDGKLALSDDIHRFFPELPDYGHKITVDHLLTHTSGVHDWLGLLPMAEEGTDALTIILRQRSLNFVPGDEWAYSNSGFELLKEIVKRVSGMPFADFARTRLFDPLGMKSSAYVPDITQGKGERAIGYQKDATGWKPFMRVGLNRGGGAVISSAVDLLVWNDALTNGRLGKFVTRKMEEPATLNNGRKLKYGRGLMLDSIPGGHLISHDGGAAGYNTWLGRFTDYGLSIAVLCNWDASSPTSLAGRVADVFLPPVDQNAPRPGPVPAQGVDVSTRAGLFFDTRTGEPMRLVAGNGRLSIMNGLPLVAVSADRFRPSRPSLFYRSQDDFEITFRSNDEYDMRSQEGQVATFRRAPAFTADARDLEDVGGRYSSADLGQVFEIVPGANGIAFRFERSPERVIPMEAVARDTYMQGMAIVRFQRDANGKVTGFDYGNPAARNFKLTRIGDLAAGSATKESPAAAADAPKLETLTGDYEAAPGRYLVITLEYGKLFGQPTGAAKRSLTHTSGTTFSVDGAPMTLTFTLGPDGRPTALVMRQGGDERTLRKVR